MRSVAGAVLALCVLGISASVAPKPHAPQVFRGRFSGKCDNDGIYYRDSKSFVFCSGGNSYIQPCAPGTENSEYEVYEAQLGEKTYNTEYCNINLVDSGYFKHPGSYMASIEGLPEREHEEPHHQAAEEEEETDKYMSGYVPRGDKKHETTVSAYNRPLYQPPPHAPHYRPHPRPDTTHHQPDVYNTDRGLYDLDRSSHRGRSESRYGQVGIRESYRVGGGYGGRESYERRQSFKRVHMDYDPRGMHPPYLREQTQDPKDADLVEPKFTVLDPHFNPSHFPHLAIPQHGLIIKLPAGKGSYSEDIYDKDFADTSSQYNDVRPKHGGSLFHPRRSH